MRIIDKQGRELGPDGPVGDAVGLMKPGYCIFTKDIDGPYLDTDFNLTDVYPHGYIHVPFVEQMGRAVGMVPRSEVEGIQEKLAVAVEELAELRKQADALIGVAEVFA